RLAQGGILAEHGELAFVYPLRAVFARVVHADHAGDVAVARVRAGVAGQGAPYFAFCHLRLHHIRMNVSSASPSASSMLYPAIEMPKSVKAGTSQRTTSRLEMKACNSSRLAFTG